MPDEYRDLVIKLLKTTNEIGSVPAFHWLVQLLAPMADKAPDPPARIRMIDYIADEVRHMSIFDGVVRSMGIVPDEDFISFSGILGLHGRALAGTVPNPYEHMWDWVSHAVMQSMESAAGFQLYDYRNSSFAPLARAAIVVARDEFGHGATGYTHLREICRTPEGRMQAQEKLAVAWPHVLDGFGTSTGERQYKYVHYGLKEKLNEELRQEFKTYMTPLLEAVGLDVPEDETTGRLFL
jgi:1,2-phenylacetyl-CoA epoxidase catalytic subunit